MKKIFIPLLKIDEEKRLVYSTMTQEVVDKDNEVLDYESSKPNFEKWSNEIAKATDGKSLGNVRVMHGNKVAGILKSIQFIDDEKRIDCCAHILNDEEWEMVKAGAYTGMSIGGSYAKRWNDPNNKGVMRYTAMPVEVSIVDNPAVPTAHFTVVKADGLTEERAFKAAQPPAEPTVEERTMFTKFLGWLLKGTDTEGLNRSAEDYEDGFSKRDFSAGRRKELAGTGAALPDGSYPIVTEQDLKNAIHAYGRAKDKERAKRHIIARARSLGLTRLLPEGWGPSKKGAGLDEATAGMLKAVALGLSVEEASDASDDEITTLLKAVYAPTANVDLPDDYRNTLAALTKTQAAESADEDETGALLKAVYASDASDDDPMAALAKISSTPLTKSMDTVSSLAYAFQSIRNAQRCLLKEGAVEKDKGDTDMAHELGEIAQKLAVLIAKKAEHEGKEAITLTDEDDLRFAQYSGVTLTGVEQ